MSLTKLYDAVNTIANQTINEDLTPEDKVLMAKGVLKLAQAYQVMKDQELHEKFHMTGTQGSSELEGFTLPGENKPDQSHN